MNIAGERSVFLTEGQHYAILRWEASDKAWEARRKDARRTVTETTGPSTPTLMCNVPTEDGIDDLDTVDFQDLIQLEQQLPALILS